MSAPEIKSCHCGVIFALGIESGGFEDLLSGLVRIRGHGFVAKEGGLKGRRIVVIRSGPGQKNAARAAELLIDGHRPQMVISAGFAGGLNPLLKRHDILLADQVIDQEGRSLQWPLDWPGLEGRPLQWPPDWPGLHTG
ncbi:MAG TPA: hypothetical protein VIH42_11545, partial [Thermoguttaceae bacterium]